VTHYGLVENMVICYNKFTADNKQNSIDSYPGSGSIPGNYFADGMGRQVWERRKECRKIVKRSR